MANAGDLRREHERGLGLLQRAPEPYAIILADAEMPGSNGFALAEQLKQSPPQGSSLIMMLNSGIGTARRPAASRWALLPTC